jgi:hypothetical protein
MSNLPFLEEVSIDGVALRQVFGLAGVSPMAIFYRPSLPGWCPVVMTAFVPTYRCGPVPDSHRVPSCDTVASRVPGQGYYVALSLSKSQVWSQDFEFVFDFGRMQQFDNPGVLFYCFFKRTIGLRLFIV